MIRRPGSPSRYEHDSLGDLFQQAEIRREALANATGTKPVREDLPRWRQRLAKFEQAVVRLPWRRVRQGVVALLLLGGGVALYQNFAVINDWLTTKVAEATGATVQRIEVTGLQYTNQNALLQALGLERGSSLVGFDTGAARERLETLPWVRLASVERQLPATVRLQIYEYLPLARVISASALWVVNPEGVPIIEDASNIFQSLPLLQGEGAPTEAARLFGQLEPYPNLFAQLREATWVGNRRWDLKFASGVTVMLPETEVEEGIALLQRLEEARHVLTLNDGVVDLRLPDRIVLRLPPTVAATPVTNQTTP